MFLLLLASVVPYHVDENTLQSELDEARKTHDVPALGAAIVSSKGLQTLAVAGVRKKGSDVKVTKDDRFHLGSDTKAMTATLIAALIHQKLLSWDDTLEKAFPGLAKKMHDDYKPVTLELLLRHRGGLPANLPEGWESISRKDPLRKQRSDVAARTLTRKPFVAPDTEFTYSNVGYVLAGALAERAGKATWEDLMRKHLFTPLKMSTAGFGAPGTKGKVDQPWSHDSAGKPTEPGPNSDNEPVMGPAGRVHCSLGDWAKFVADHLAGANGKDGLLPAAAYAKLHEAVKEENYSPGGWLSFRGPNGLLLTHDGSNTRNYATLFVFPKRDVAILVVCNQGGDAGKKATHQVRDRLRKQLVQ